MFLCDRCRQRFYTNQPSFRQSEGPCENCHRHSLCSDIPSVALQRKRPRPRKRSAKKVAIDALARVRAQAGVKKRTPLERMETALKDDDD